MTRGIYLSLSCSIIIFHSFEVMRSPPSPFDSILLAVLTVSPKRQYRGIVNPTTPATTAPVRKYEPRHEKTNGLHMRKQRRRSASRNSEADQRLCFRYIDSTIPLLSKSSSGFPTRSHTNRALQPHKMARGLKLRI